MSLADVGRALRSHKVLVAVLSLGVLALTAAAFAQARLTYETSAAMVVLSPTRVVTPGPTGADQERIVNPFLNFGGSQETAAQVLAVRMSDDEVGRRLEDAGVTGEWTFDVRADSGSVVDVTATGPDPAAARASAERILDAASSEFAILQQEAGAPDDQLIRVEPVNAPGDPEPVYDSKVRIAVGVAALGVLGTIAAAMAAESIARSRRDRREAAAATPDETEDPPGQADALDDWDAPLDLDLLDEEFVLGGRA